MVKVEGIVADAARVVGAFLLCAAGIGCGGGGGGTGSGPGSSTRGPGMGDPPAPSVTLQGGSATAAGGQGKTGGAAHLVSSGAITIGPDFQPPAASPPGNAMAVAASRSRGRRARVERMRSGRSPPAATSSSVARCAAPISEARVKGSH